MPCPLVSEIDALKRANAALARAGRSTADALVASDAADQVRTDALRADVRALRDVVTTLRTEMRPAADYFAARGAVEGTAAGEASAAGERLSASAQSALATVLENAHVRRALVVFVVAVLAWLSVATRIAGSSQAAWDRITAAPPSGPDAHQEHP